MDVVGGRHFAGSNTTGAKGKMGLKICASVPLGKSEKRMIRAVRLNAGPVWRRKPNLTLAGGKKLPPVF